MRQLFILSFQVFFRAGVLGTLEDMRDEQLSKIISQFQAFAKGFLMRRRYRKMCDQR
jgi:myosin heavy subunit